MKKHIKQFQAVNTTDVGGQYNTKYAFAKKQIKPKGYLDLGYVVLNQNLEKYMSKDDAYQIYRKMINKFYNIDINKFTQTIKGGKADFFDIHEITMFKFKEIYYGIKIQRQHTDDNFVALQIALDHLKQFDNYYQNLIKMQKKLQKMKG